MSGEPLDHFAEAVERSAKDAERLMESVVKACQAPAGHAPGSLYPKPHAASLPAAAPASPCRTSPEACRGASLPAAAPAPPRRTSPAVRRGACALMRQARARAGVLRALRAQLLAALAAQAAVLVHQQRLHHLRPPHPHQRALGRPPHPGAPARRCLRRGRRSGAVPSSPNVSILQAVVRQTCTCCMPLR